MLLTTFAFPFALMPPWEKLEMFLPSVRAALVRMVRPVVAQLVQRLHYQTPLLEEQENGSSNKSNRKSYTR